MRRRVGRKDKVLVVEDRGGQDGKGDGSRVGWFCAYTPLEPIIACGFEPQKLLGSGNGTEAADGILQANLCPYVRACLEQGLSGDAPSALVFAGCCDSMRRLKDAWERYCRPRFTYMLDLPRGSGPRELELFTMSVKGLIAGLEELSGHPMSAVSLKEAIFRRSRADSRLAEISAMAAGGGLSGSSLNEAFVRAQTMSHADTRETSLPSGAESSPGAKPVVLSGNISRDGRLVRLVEECGGHVAALDLCSGARFLTWTDGLPDLDGMGVEDLVFLLAVRYLDKTPCPRMSDHSRRDGSLLELVKETGAGGVIHVPLMFCDPCLYDLPRLQHRLREAGVPGLVLQSDYQDENLGGLRTRIEAFLEMI